MNKHRLQVGKMLGIVIATFVWTTACLAAHPLDRVPAEARLVVYCEDIAELSRKFVATDPGKLLTGDLLAPVVAELKRQGMPSPLYLQPWFGFDWSDLSQIDGPVALAAIAGKSPQEVDTVWVFSDRTVAASACLDRAKAYFLEQRFTVHEGKNEHGSWQRFERRSGDETRTCILFRGAGVCGVATREQAAAAVLSTSDKEAVRKQKLFEKLLPADRPLSAQELGVYVRPFDLWEAVYDPVIRKRGQRNLLTMARRLGYDSAAAAGGIIALSPGTPVEVQANLHILAPMPHQGALAMFDFQPGAPIAPLGRWPEKAGGYRAWRWDVLLAMRAFGHVFDEVSMPGPEGEGLFEDLLDGLRDDPEGPRVDLRRELFRRLGPVVREFIFTPATGEPAVVYEIECRERAKILDLLRRYYELDREVKRRDIAGAALWTVGEERSLFVEGEDDSPLKVQALAVTEKHILVATDESVLLSVLHRQDKAAPNDESQWQRLIAQWGDDPAGLWGFIKTAKVGAATYGHLQEGKESDDQSWAVPLLRYLVFGAFRPAAEQPRKLLPAYDKMVPFLNTLGYTATMNKDGWTLELHLLGK